MTGLLRHLLGDLPLDFSPPVTAALNLLSFTDKLLKTIQGLLQTIRKREAKETLNRIDR